MKRGLNGKNKWKIINKEIKTEEKIPTRILNNGEDIRSPKVLANKFNNYFKEKVAKIRKDFRQNKDKAMKILKNLVKKPNTEFEFKAVSIYEVYECIKR